MANRPEFDGVAPRISGDVLQQYRGRYVTLVVECQSLDEERNVAKGFDIISNIPCNIDAIPHNELSSIGQMNEFTLFVDASQGRLLYHSHCVLDDDFDRECYATCVKLMEKHQPLFK